MNILPALVVSLEVLLINAATVRFPLLPDEAPNYKTNENDLKAFLSMMLRVSEIPEDIASLQKTISIISPDEAVGFPKQIVLGFEIGDADGYPEKGLKLEVEGVSCFSLPCLQNQLVPKTWSSNEQLPFVSSASKAREVHLNSLHDSPGYLVETSKLINQLTGHQLVSVDGDAVLISHGERSTRLPIDMCTSMLMTDMKAIATLEGSSSTLVSLAPIFGLQCMQSKAVQSEQMEAASYAAREVTDAFIAKQSLGKGSDFFALIVALPKTAKEAGGYIDLMSEKEILSAAPAAARRLQKAPPKSRRPSVNAEVTYQIRLWTILSMVFILFAAIVITMNMQNKKDPLLYTKLQTTR